MRKAVSGLILALLVIGMLTLALNIQPVKAWSGTVYIRADGSIDPPSAPIKTYDNTTYTLSDNITSPADGIVVERDNIIIDGAGYMIQGELAMSSKGISLSGKSNVTIKNMEICAFNYGIFVSSSSNSIISGNIIANNIAHVTNEFYYGIWLNYSLNISICGNNITNNQFGIKLDCSSNNTIFRNNLSMNGGAGWDVIELYNSSNNNIVENNIIANTGYGIKLDLSSNNNVSQNKIVRNISDGVFISGSWNNIISKNYVSDHNNYGVNILSAFNNTLYRNAVINNRWGIQTTYSWSNRISFNDIANNSIGVIIHNSSDCNVISNNITTNSEYGIWISESFNNRVYHNSLVNNTQQVYDRSWDYPFISPSTIVWDNGYPSGGNYWSNYTGVDLCGGSYQNETGSDGIGDTPYIIDANNIDRYPLMGPFSTFEVKHWDGLTYNLDIVSNFSISDFKFRESLIPEFPSTISFNVSGHNNTMGFCRVTIPNIIVEDLWQGNYTVLLNGEPWPFRNWKDATNTYIYVNYTHSEYQIIIIPEFPSAIILPLLMLTTLTAIILLRRKGKTKLRLP